MTMTMSTIACACGSSVVIDARHWNALEVVGWRADEHLLLPHVPSERPVERTTASEEPQQMQMQAMQASKIHDS
jgi:hypothetical protein